MEATTIGNPTIKPDRHYSYFLMQRLTTIRKQATVLRTYLLRIQDLFHSDKMALQCWWGRYCHTIAALAVLSLLGKGAHSFVPASIRLAATTKICRSPTAKRATPRMPDDPTPTPSSPPLSHPFCQLPGDPSLILTTNADLGDQKMQIMKGSFERAKGGPLSHAAYENNSTLRQCAAVRHPPLPCATRSHLVILLSLTRDCLPCLHSMFLFCNFGSTLFQPFRKRWWSTLESPNRTLVCVVVLA